MTVEIVDYAPEHLQKLVVQPAQRGFRGTLEISHHIASNTAAVTFLDGERVLLIAGVTPMHLGVGEVWSMISEGFGENPITITSSIRGMLDGLQLKGEFHRLQAYVEWDFENGHRWARILGFKREGIMHSYGTDKKDYALYARVI